jgi:hypothetical protein
MDFLFREVVQLIDQFVYLAVIGFYLPVEAAKRAVILI